MIDTATLTAKWWGASRAARKSEHHWPADCLAEAAIVVEALTAELAVLRATVAETRATYARQTYEAHLEEFAPLGSLSRRWLRERAAMEADRAALVSSPTPGVSA